MKRFWSKVEKTEGCWLWKAALGGRGYGNFRFQKKTTYAHRVAWILANGPIPEDLDVCHRCDTPNCVRPDHLFLGTHTDNMRDMFAKGRRDTVRGSSHKLAKLTETDVRQIRTDARAQAEIAKAYGVSFGLIWKIKKNLVWRHV